MVLATAGSSGRLVTFSEQLPWLQPSGFSGRQVFLGVRRIVPGTSSHLESHTGSFSLMESSRMLNILILGGEHPILLTPCTSKGRSIHPCVLSPSLPSCHRSTLVCPALHCMLPYTCSDLIRTAPRVGGQCPPHLPPHPLHPCSEQENWSRERFNDLTCLSQLVGYESFKT